jgi:hypothetical protein
MITPSYLLTATERVLPRLALDFTTAALDPRVTFTRAGNTATVINSSGVIVGVNADIPRFDYNPTTLLCNGLLIEESRTNVLLNSLIDGTILGTQAVVVTAAARTLSFYGTGQIVLSGAHSATVTGTGAYPARTTLTFTPTSGTLTLTVTGTVQFAQLELGSFATSFIPTAGSQVTRSADVATMTGTNFSDWYNATEGTFVAWGTQQSEDQAGGQRRGFANISDGSNTNRMGLSPVQFAVVTSGSSVVNQTFSGFVANQNYKIAGAYKLNNSQSASNATLSSNDTACTVPTVTQLQFGTFRLADGLMCGYLQKFMYYPQRLTSAEVQAISK